MIRLFILLAIWQLTTYNATAQTDTTTTKEYTVVEEMPQYPGGKSAMVKYISKNLQYPKKAIKAGIEGKVLMKFTISRGGDVTNVSVLKGLSEECDIEAVRVIEAMPQWKPGRQGGKAVNVTYFLPISFKFKKEKKK